MYAVGDFNSKAMRKTVEATFGSWKPADGQPKVPPKLPQVPVPFPRPGVAPDTTGFLVRGSTASALAVCPLQLSHTRSDEPEDIFFARVSRAFGGHFSVTPQQCSVRHSSRSGAIGASPGVRSQRVAPA